MLENIPKYFQTALLFIVFVSMITFGFLGVQGSVNAVESEKVTICHATGSESNPWTKIIVGPSAINGHFEENGTPLSGHEEDLLFSGNVDCPIDDEPDPTLGSINICKIIVVDGEVVDGNDFDGTFEISGLDIDNNAGVLPTSEFTTPLNLNTDIFGSENNDAQCILYDELLLGIYFYAEEEIDDSSDWEEPLYNDQFSTPIEDLDDFFSYKSSEGGLNVDGEILLKESRPNRTLVVLNEFKEIETPYAPYCGDGEVNQSWEQCDGGNSCTVQCQSENQTQCTEIAFARVNVDNVENWGTGNTTSDIFLGSSSNKIPASAWFLLHINGVFEEDDDMTTASYEDVKGIAVERSEVQIRTLLHGSMNQQGGPNKEHVDGNIEFFGATINSQTSDDSGNNKYERFSDGNKTLSAGNDELWLESGNTTQSFFWATVTVADDGFFTEYEEDLMCEIENHIPIIILIGSSTINVDIGNSFTDEGATADDFEDGDITDDIVVAGDTVDTNIEGSYIITYDVTDSDGADADQVTRTVNVIDSSIPPQCSDEIDNDEDGFTDIADPACHTDGDPDNPNSYDGDIDDENSKPVITLTGDSVVTVELNGDYTDLGATADDDEDGDNIPVAGVGTVATSTVGSYTMTYNFTDSGGLSADEVTRTVNVIDSSIPPQCSDEIDNDGDELVDSDDPGCHTDDDPENPYDPEDNDENVKPFITLIGSSTINLNINDTYTEEKADVDDLEDGEINHKLVISGDFVDVSIVGTYIVTYNATDTQNVFADQVTRNVVINSEEPPVCTSNCGGGGGGGGPRPEALRIFDEKLQIISEGVALITWKTNKSSNSRVVYDVVSHTVQTNSLHPNFINQSIDYIFTTETTDDLVTEHSMLITILNTESFYYFRPISEDSTRAIGIELDSILGDIAVASCSQYLFEFIKQGNVNDADEVRKLQIFLRDFEGFDSLDINGIYDDATYNAVIAFQSKYGEDVLSPWGLESDTGYVYLTTRKKVNEIYCNNQLTFPLTQRQQAEVDSFRALVQTLQETGQQLPDTSSVGFAPSQSSLVETVLLSGVESDEENEEDMQRNIAGSLAVTIEAFENSEGVVNRFFGRVGNFIKNIFRR